MMKKEYINPQLRTVSINGADIICISDPYTPNGNTNPYGPDSEIIPVGGEEGDEQVAPPPSSRARGMWIE